MTEHEAECAPVPPSSVSLSGENTTPAGKDTGEASWDAQGVAEGLPDLSEDDERDVQTALRAVEADNAGHWPTVASVLAAEVLRLRGLRLPPSPLPNSEPEPGSFADAYMRASADTTDMDVISARMAAEGWQEKRVPLRVDSETEWGWRRTYDKPDDVVVAFSEDDARSRIAFLHNAVVVSRPVGPWTVADPEVTS